MKRVQLSWSRNYGQCISCGRSESKGPHRYHGAGECYKCYFRRVMRVRAYEAREAAARIAKDRAEGKTNVTES
jgi:hypothetical protein